MNKLILFAVLSFTILSISSCDKNDNPPPSNTDYLTKSSWKFSSAKAAGIDVSAQIPACFKDNTITFVANGTGTISEGANVCTPAAPSTFTWTFQNNGSQINLSTPLLTGGSGLFTIVSLNDASLVVSQSVTIPPSTTPIPAEITFVH